MNALSTIDRTVHDADALARAAQAYAEAARSDPQDAKATTMFLRLALCEAFDAVVPAGALDEMDDLRWRLNIDEEGHPLDGDGFPLASFNPSRIHPNDLCQSKGRL
ncbi:hypothetical protein [Pelagerythrobacter marinus]|uniref:hypothetical protein n=1 Tax=Pelagerythrobacter marinus TaxID=538382 RepID=UPI002AC96D55|nr:hypothetical protein [Pelagerythrobacter marinus]WPZ05519.1 hypothetical protein T8T98_08740 [Pelagerythrobacter marinus]